VSKLKARTGAAMRLSERVRTVKALFILNSITELLRSDIELNRSV
jgi:hypothetical protein